METYQISWDSNPTIKLTGNLPSPPTDTFPQTPGQSVSGSDEAPHSKLSLTSIRESTSQKLREGNYRKRGPKRDNKAPSTRRQERNRIAQRLCRDRKEHYLQSLEQAFRSLQVENANLNTQNVELHAELLVHQNALEVTPGQEPLSGHGLQHASGSAIPSRQTTGIENEGSIPPTDPVAGSPPQGAAELRISSLGITDHAEICMTFVLKLEHLCHDHIHPKDAHRAEDAGMTFGHSLMLTTFNMAQTEQHKEGVWDPTRAQTQEMLGKLLDLSSNLNLTTEITPIMAWDIVEKQDIFPHMAAADFEFVMEQIKPHMRCHGFGAVFPAEHLWIALDALKSRILDPTAVQVKPAPPSPTPVPSSPASLVRLQCRSGSLSSPTVDLAPGFAQANLLVLPLEYAKDFRDLCLRNPVPCPLLACSTDVGDPTCTSDASILAGVFDLRTDLPRYNVYSEGELVSTPTDIMKEWTSKHVAFLIGCSFTFENALSRAGLTPRHLERRVNVSMFNTTEKLNPSGIFQNATYVVSMRPYLPEQIEQVRNITRPFISMHGEPIDWGWDACGRLGIADVSNPDFGDPVEFKDGEVPVFWGCGVTPQLAVIAAGNKINGPVMAHAPGHMLVLDWKEEDIVTNPAHHITVMNMVEADRENEFYRPSPMES